ncbi:MAG: hypothetical protein ACNA75_06095 [Thiohalomonadaceae bacterium]
MHFKIRRYFFAQQPLGRVAGLVRGLVQSFFQAIIVRSGNPGHCQYAPGVGEPDLREFAEFITDA